MKIIDSSIVYEGRFRTVRERIENSQGKTFQHETIKHPGAVVILPIAQDGRVILIEQYRHSVGEVLLELPAGTLEAGEAPIVCAGRELQEEIGMAAREIIPLGEQLPAPGFCDEKQYLFCARSLYESKMQADEDEEITTLCMTRGEIETAILQGRLKDAKSISLFMKVILAGLL